MSTAVHRDATDPLLDRLLRARNEEREREISEVIASIARPIAEGVIQRFARTGDVVSPQDAEDIIATAMLRLVAKLRGAAESPHVAIERLPDYAARLTFNAVHDHFRSRYPERTRLKNRLRYALSHDPRLAIWTIRERLAGGLAPWRGSTRARATAMDLPDSIIARGRDADHPAETLVALFRHAGEPFLLHALIDTVAPLWPTGEVRYVPSARLVETRSPLARLEWRELLSALWSEIVQLRPLQRKTLLLNLRDTATSHALGLFVLTETTTMGAIAQALEMEPPELAAIWNDLPLDDLHIADMLHLTRQQVINLRKSARERLTRRLEHLRNA